jgi:hypothetical protein
VQQLGQRADMHDISYSSLPCQQVADSLVESCAECRL